MQPEAGQDRNWRDAAAYAPLLGADASLLAWEWLRRNPAYWQAAEGALGTGGQVCFDRASAAGPEHWGLHRFERPELRAPFARPIWHARVHPHVLVVCAGAAGDAAERFDLQRLGPLATVATSIGREHVLLSDGSHAIRLDVVDGSVIHGPVELEYRIRGVASARLPLLALRRLLALCGRGDFSPRLHCAGAVARRHVLMLRAYDAISAEATQRDIAAELFGAEISNPGWRVRESPARSRVQRLVRRGRDLSAGGYLALLRL